LETHIIFKINNLKHF